MDAIDDVASSLSDASLGGTAGAQSQSEARVLIADHGANIIWRIVGGRTDGLASRAGDGDTSRVVGIILHGWNDLHTTSREGVAVDVGQVIGDLAVGPGELKLRDGSRSAVLRSKLDGDTNTLLAVALAVATLECCHSRVGATTDGGVVHREATVVDDGSSPHSGHTRRGGEQNGSAREDVFELHV